MKWRPIKPSFLVAWIISILDITITCHAAPQKFKVEDSADLAALLSRGGRIIVDYGGFQVVEAETTAWAGLSGAAEAKEEWNSIFLNTGVIRTERSQPAMGAQTVEAFPGKRLHLVQFAGPIQSVWVSTLVECGLQIVNYVSHNAYLIYGDAAALGRFRASPGSEFVQWDGVFEPEHKVHPHARMAAGQLAAQAASSGALFAVQLLSDPQVNADSLAFIEQIGLAPIHTQFRTLHFLNVIVALPPERLDEVAARPDVISIRSRSVPMKRDERQAQVIAGNVSDAEPLGPGYLAWLENKGFSQEQFDASGFIVDVADSGIDNGTVTPGHFALYRLGQVDGASRVVYSRLEGTPNFRSTLQGCDGHGNLNAHLIAGYSGFVAGFPHADSTGFAYGVGICPYVRIGASVIFDPDDFTNPDYAALQSRAYASGARISANSWGSDGVGAYDVDAQAFDALARDAQPAGSPHASTGNQQMVLVFAAGNAGPNPRSINSPGSAKNVIAVGASESVRSLHTNVGGNSESGSDGCGTPDFEADSINDVLGFSGRGPTEDGRMKPDVVAPGSHVTGGAPQFGTPTTDGTGVGLGCFDATGVCGLPGSGQTGKAENFFPLSQQFYTVSSGTSHAVPAVAGACALIRQYFINQFSLAPSPAMTRAFLMNSTRYLDGAGANDTLWSTTQGMGAADLGTAFDGVPRILRDEVTSEKFTASGQTRRISGHVADPTKPFRVTLAWTDAPGNTFGQAFNNDLDLTVTIGGQVYRGNVFSGAHSIPGGAPDPRNNVESILLPPGFSGNFVVAVRSANINSDGVPNEAPAVDQDFALVVYNATEASVPVIRISAQQIIEEGCSPANGIVDAGELVVMNVTLVNDGLLATTNLSVQLLSTNGVMFPSAIQNYGALVPGGEGAARPFSFVAAGTCGTFVKPTFLVEHDGIDEQLVSFDLFLGETNSGATRFTNSTAIVVPSVGEATPYPSSIVVSNVPGVITRIAVSLAGIGHGYPGDIDAVLRGPSGQSVVLMSDAGADLTAFNTTLTFDDGAVSKLPEFERIVSGVYKPTNYDPQDDGFPGVPGPHAEMMAVFNGSSANGTWSLYVQDDSSFDSGSINGGWRLAITTLSSTCCPGTIVIHSVSAVDGAVVLAWTSVAGQRYRVQWKHDLAEPSWQDIEPDIIADGPVTTFTDPLIRGQQYYRVLRVD